MIRKKQLPEVDPVVLKSFGSMRPGQYILIGIITALILLFFLVFFLHGLVTDKSYIAFDTSLKGVAIYQDSKYLGSTEGSVYRTTSGKHEYEFIYNNISLGKVEHDVERYFFATIFRRPLQIISFTASPNSTIQDEMSTTFANEISEWSKFLDYSDRYHFPPLYSEFAKNAIALGFEDISSAWLYGAMHVTSKTLYNDYLEGLSILENSSIKYMSEELKALNAKLPEILSDNAPVTEKNEINNYALPERDGEFFFYPDTLLAMGESSSVSYPECNTYPVNVEVERFGISAVAVSEYEYALFVEENPQWDKSNKSELMKQGLVDDYYLNGIALNTDLYSAKPIRNISYYAAEAFCAWLSEKTGNTFTLPTEAEWTLAAYSSSAKPYTKSLISTDSDMSSPQNMLGQVWEFTSTPYIPLMRVGGYESALELASIYPSEDIIIKGGSYINDSNSINANTVGVTTKKSCSEYVGFRVSAR